jgi:hypothetical protein
MTIVVRKSSASGAGASVRDIQARGGWRSAAVLNYIVPDGGAAARALAGMM